MNRINTGFIVDPSIQQPYTSGSVNFLQDVTKETANAICRSLIESKGYSYINTVPYQIANAFDHFYVFFNGELYYLTDSIIGTENIAVLTITPEPTADPVLFTDGFSRNVHEVRTLVATTGTLGTGLFDLQDIVYINISPISVPTLLNSWSIGVGSNVFYKVDNKTKLVTFNGALQKTLTDGGVMFNLPANHRPNVDKYLPVVEYDGFAGSNKPVVLYVNASNGNVSIYGPLSTGAVTVYINGANFFIS